MTSPLSFLFYVVCPGCGEETYWQEGTQVKLDGCTLKCPDCSHVFKVTTSPDFKRNLAWLAEV